MKFVKRLFEYRKRLVSEDMRNNNVTESLDFRASDSIRKGNSIYDLIVKVVYSGSTDVATKNAAGTWLTKINKKRLIDCTL